MTRRLASAFLADLAATLLSCAENIKTTLTAHVLAALAGRIAP